MKNLYVITSSRADYGLLRNLITEIKKNSKKYKLSIFATGTHLSKKYGETYKEIIEDGFKIKKKIYLPIKNDSAKNISECLAVAIKNFGRVFEKLNPDAILILGDRFEILGVAIASIINRVPIIHLHGGETTYGAYDDAFRHSISKMSSIHFVTNAIYKKRLEQLGENPKKIFVVGALGIDNIVNLKKISKKNLEKELKIVFSKKNLLVTFHPVTLEKNTALKNINILLSVLNKLKDTSIFFTMSNSDSESDIINKKIKSFVIKNKNSYLFKSLGSKKYISLLYRVDAIIGNSSSGVIEAPFLKIPTLNIGNRQEGRMMSESVICCKSEEKDILKGIEKIFTKKFQQKLKISKNLFGKGDTSKKILKILDDIKIDLSIKKKFYDLPYQTIKLLDKN